MIKYTIYQLDDIIGKISKAKYHFTELYIADEDILISIPEYLLTFFQAYHYKLFPTSDATKVPISHLHIFGLLPTLAPDNKITVYVSSSPLDKRFTAVIIDLDRYIKHKKQL